MAHTLIAVTLAGLIFLALGVSVYRNAQPETLSPKTTYITESPRSPDQASLAPASTTPADTQPDFVKTLAAEMQREFGIRIAEVAVQARLYLIRQDVIKRFPAKGNYYFNQALHLAFPERATAILDLLDTLHRYNEWLTTEHLALMELSPLERQGRLWQKRRELFGEDAELIWAEERSKLAEKQQAVQDILLRLDNNTSIGLDEKLYQLNTELSATFDAEHAYVLENGGMIAEVFFSLDSVQQELAQMPTQDRQASIDRVRRQMGYSEEQISRLRERDTQKNQRWSKGKAYMAERQQLASRLEGDEWESAVEALRQEYFGHEAKTIRLEEQNGFFRYERPRYYGRN